MDAPQNHNDERLLRLSEYLDGTLEPEARAAVERELAQDGVLRAEFEALRKVDELVRRRRTAIPQIDWERFTQEARRRRESLGESRGASDRRARRQSRRPPLVFRPWPAWCGLAAAAAIAIVLTASLVLRSTRPVEVRTSPEAGRAIAVITLERTPIDRGPAGAAQPVAIVRVSQTPPEGAKVAVKPAPAGAAHAVAIVQVSQTLPKDAMVTVGPVPQGRALVVAVGNHGQNKQAGSEQEDLETLF